jgi:hypothetical protein
MWKNIVELDGPKMTIRQMRIACWITKATDTHSELFNPLTTNDLQRRRAVSPLKIKIPSNKSRQAALREGI